MKRIFWIILMVMPFCTVRAAEWIEVEEIPTMTGNTLEIKEEKEYKWYKLRKEGDYFKEAPSNEFMKTDFWTYTSWSEWSNEYPENKEFIDTRTVYHYQEMKKIKYIRLSNRNNDNFVFASISLYKGSELLSYNKQEQDGTVILELEEPCYYEELELELYLVNGVKEENAFFIEWLYDLNSPSCAETYTRQIFDLSVKVSFRYRNMKVNQLLYEEEKISFEKIEPNMHTVVWKGEEYRFKERLFYYEKETKLYYPEYSTIPIEDYIYPDWNTEKIKLLVKLNTEEIVDPPTEQIVEIIKEVPIEKWITKEVPIENTIVKEIMVENQSDLKQENNLLKEKIENLKQKIENSKKKASIDGEISEPVVVKKQSLEQIFYVVCFLLGYLIGRIVPMKKKF